MNKFFTKKRVIIGVVVLVVLAIIIAMISGGGNNAANIQTSVLQKQDLKKTVLANGTVVSGIDLGLSFKVSGVVKSLPATVGKKVRSGEVLAMLSNSSESASLTQARGSLASAQANLQKVLDGASSEDVEVAQKSVDAAKIALANAQKNVDITKAQNDVIVKNAYSALLNSTLSAYPAGSNISQSNPVIAGTYSGNQQGQYLIKIYATGSGYFYNYSGLETGQGQISSFGAPTPLGTKGLNITFSGITSASVGDSWTVSIPNTQASNYTTNLNAYNAAIEAQKAALTSAENAVATAQASVDQANAQLNLKKAQARPADIAAAQAQVLSAQGQVQAASAAYENTVLRAPADGTVTLVDVKLGEQAQALKAIVKLQNLSSLHVESFISEANVALLKPGQSVSYTFDAFGTDKKFDGILESVDPASVVQSGVVNYKVTSSLPQIPDIKPGLTTDMTVLIDSRTSVLSVPSRAITEKDGKKTVKVITDPKKKTYEEKEVTTGLEDSGGSVEILSGLTEGQEIVTLIKK